MFLQIFKQFSAGVGYRNLVYVSLVYPQNLSNIGLKVIENLVNLGLYYVIKINQTNQPFLGTRKTLLKLFNRADVEL